MNLNKINNKSAITTLFSFFTDKQIDYVWLHGYNNEDIGDIDIAVTEEEFKQIESTIREFCSAQNFQLLQIIQHEYCAKYFVLGRIDDNSIEFLIPDICSNYVRDGRILIKADALLKDRLYNGKFYHCNELVEAEYIFLKRTLKKKWEISHFIDFKNIYIKNKSATENILGKYLKNNLCKELIESIEKDDIVSLNRPTGEVRKSILFRIFIKNPFQYFYYQINNIIRIIKRVLKTTGLFIVVIGTDGSGKSTVINKLTSGLAPIYRRTALYHWKPTFFYKNNSENFIVTEPHKQEPRSTLISVIKLLLYFFQYLFGYVFKIFPMEIRSTLVVFDRYYYDMIVDQKRFRLKLPKKIIQLFSNLVHKPDLVFYLKTEPSIALQRKNELDLEELERQNKEFASLINVLHNRFYLINNDGDVDSTINKISSVVFNYLEKRLIN